MTLIQPYEWMELPDVIKHSGVPVKLKTVEDVETLTSATGLLDAEIARLAEAKKNVENSLKRLKGLKEKVQKYYGEQIVKLYDKGEIKPKVGKTYHCQNGVPLKFTEHKEVVKGVKVRDLEKLMADKELEQFVNVVEKPATSELKLDTNGLKKYLDDVIRETGEISVDENIELEIYDKTTVSL